MTAWGGITELLGDEFDDIEFIGRGSSGSVYRATQRALGRTVAVKVFPQLAGTQADRVMTEARAQALLSWHANVITLYGQGVTRDGFPYLVMEYAPGGSLADRVAIRGPLTDSDWRRLGGELAAALAEAHANGIVHCDVKPSNVLFAADGSVRLADFGIARGGAGATGTLDNIEGSLAYIAPELLDGAKPGPPGDVYGLALTMLFAATGNHPIPSDLSLAVAVAKIGTGDLDTNGFGLPDASALRDALEKATALAPSRRPSAAELQRVFTDSLPSMSPLGPPPTRRSRLRSAYWAWGVALLAVAILAGGLALRSVAAPASEPRFDLCSEYSKYVRARRALMTDVSADLEQNGSPVAVVRRLLIEYPAEFGVLAQPFIQNAAPRAGVSGSATRDQLASMTYVSNLSSLSGGKQIINDGESGSYDAEALPLDVQRPAFVFSEVNRFAAKSCPGVDPSMEAQRARMHTAIYANLQDEQFMSGFFEDPRSLKVFSAEMTLLFMQVSWGFFEVLLQGHWDWFFELLERQPELRRSLMLERPDSVLTAVDRQPELIPTLQQPEWKQEFTQGYNLASAVSRSGMWQMFPDWLRELELEPT